jgi:hypothetical protein
LGSRTVGFALSYEFDDLIGLFPMLSIDPYSAPFPSLLQSLLVGFQLHFTSNDAMAR